MPRTARAAAGGYVYHVLNRANGRARIFTSDADYHAFERILHRAVERFQMRLLTYAIMPSHWHQVIWPEQDQQMPRFVHWLTLKHTQKWHFDHGTQGEGHVYQARYKSFPVQSDDHLLSVCRYVERNPVCGRLVEKAEDWPWTRLGAERNGSADVCSDWPVPRPSNWHSVVNTPQTKGDFEALRLSVVRSRPFGDSIWQQRTVASLGLGHTMNSRGRPRKEKAC